MEFIVRTQSYILPSTERKIEISYQVGLKSLNGDQFSEIYNTNIDEYSENIWYSQFINKFGISLQQCMPSNYAWKQYYLWLTDGIQKKKIKI